MQVELKRVYEDASQNDGIRILVDRIWPRGVRKTDAQLDHWYKEIAPSTELRRWFNHDADKFQMFKKKYKMELEQEEKKQLVNQVRDLAKEQKVTLIFAAKDKTYNHVQVLKEVVEKGAD